MFAYIHDTLNIIFVFKNPDFNYTEFFTFVLITYKLVAYEPVCEYFFSKQTCRVSFSVRIHAATESKEQENRNNIATKEK